MEDATDWAAQNVGGWLADKIQHHRATQEAFHTETRLKDGRPVLILDIGSVGSLGGDEWALHVASAAQKHGRSDLVKQVKRDRPLNVSGVGNGSQQCRHNCVLPVALERTDGSYSKGTFEVPTIKSSGLPGLLGLLPLRRSRAIIDCEKLQVHFAGPGDYELERMLPPGTESFQGELTPSGHFGLPCAEYAGLDQQERHGRLQTGEELSLPVVTSSSSSSLP